MEYYAMQVEQGRMKMGRRHRIPPQRCTTSRIRRSGMEDGVLVPSAMFEVAPALYSSGMSVKVVDGMVAEMKLSGVHMRP